MLPTDGIVVVTSGNFLILRHETEQKCRFMSEYASNNYRFACLSMYSYSTRAIYEVIQSTNLDRFR
jgi:hypothetical protein